MSERFLKTSPRPEWLRIETYDGKQMRPTLIRADQVVSLTEHMNGWTRIGLTDGQVHIVRVRYGKLASTLKISNVTRME